MDKDDEGLPDFRAYLPASIQKDLFPRANVIEYAVPRRTEPGQLMMGSRPISHALWRVEKRFANHLEEDLVIQRVYCFVLSGQRTGFPDGPSLQAVARYIICALETREELVTGQMMAILHYLTSMESPEYAASKLMAAIREIQVLIDVLSKAELQTMVDIRERAMKELRDGLGLLKEFCHGRGVDMTQIKLLTGYYE